MYFGWNIEDVGKEIESLESQTYKSELSSHTTTEKYATQSTAIQTLEKFIVCKKWGDKNEQHFLTFSLFVSRFVVVEKVG